MVKEPGLIAYDLSTEEGEFLAFGQDEESLLTELVNKGHNPDSIGLLSLEGERFNPTIVSFFLSYYVRAAANRIRPGVKKILLLSDRWHYDIQIPGYEDLPEDVCGQFEWLMIHSLKAYKTSTINGQRVGRLWRRRSALDAMLAFLYVILMPGVFGLSFCEILQVTGVLDLEPIPVWVIVISAVLMFVLLFASIMVNALLLGIIWALAKRRPFTESFWSSLLPKAIVQRASRLVSDNS